MAIDTHKRRHRALNAVLHPARVPLFPFPYDGKSTADRAHVAGFYYPVVEQRQEYAIYYAIELTLSQYVGKELAPTIEEIGLKDGIFRWITGAPGFYDSDIKLFDEHNSEICNSWYEGILIKDGFSNPSRKIDIKDGGDYATLNAFNFAVRNDMFFWKKIEENKIYIANSTVKIYAVLDKTFFSLWQGVVKSTSYTETDYEFKCETNFKVIHKSFPPQVVTETFFPPGNVNKDALGQVIPVCLGNIPYAKGLNVSTAPEAIKFEKINNDGFCSVFAAIDYRSDDYIGESFLYLKTDNVKPIENDSLKNRYLRIIKGGGDDYYRIITNENAPQGTNLTLDGVLEKWETESGYGSSKLDAIWYFQILDLPPIRYIVSQNAIDTGERDNHHFYNYENEYLDVDFAVKGHRFNEEFPSFFTIPETDIAAKIELENSVELKNEHYPRLTDKVRHLKSSIGIIQDHTTNPVNIIFDLEVTGDIDDAEQLCLVVDMDCININIFNRNWKFMVSVFAKDSYDEIFRRDMLVGDDGSFEVRELSALSFNKLNLITNNLSNSELGQYYYGWGLLDATDRGTCWPKAVIDGQNFDMELLTTLNQDIISTALAQSDDKKVRFKVRVRTDEDISIVGMFLYIKEICFSIRRGNRREWIQIKAGGIRAVKSNPGENCSVYHDRLRGRGYLHIENGTSFLEAEYEIDVPNAVMDSDIESNLCIDADVACCDGDNTIKYFFECTAHLLTDPEKNLFRNNMMIGPLSCQNCTYNFLPDTYYLSKSVSYRDIATSLWPIVADNRFGMFNVKNRSTLNKDIIELMKSEALTKNISVNIKIEKTQNVDTAILLLKQIGLIAIKKREFKEDGVYTHSNKGEVVDDVESNSVYGAFYNILRRYDRVNIQKINFKTLPVVRGASSHWCVGRQITEQKKSFDYLKELCKQSFVGIVPGRDGTLILNAWLQQGMKIGDIPFFDEKTIIRDSIKNFRRTEPQDLYNDFKIYYAYNPGADRFDKCIYVTNAWEDEFPAIDETNSVEQKKWVTFVGGIPFNKDDEEQIYGIAKRLWLRCKAGYHFSGKSHNAPSTLCNLDWCTASNEHNADSMYVLEYLRNLIYWTTAHKAQVDFSIPLNGYTMSHGESDTTTRNLTIELLDPVLFRDTIYTHSRILLGYVTKIDVDLKKNQIKLGVIFEPDDYSDVIIERGRPLNDERPFIIENGKRNDIIIEGII